MGYIYKQLISLFNLTIFLKLKITIDMIKKKTAVLKIFLFEILNLSINEDEKKIIGKPIKTYPPYLIEG